MTKFSETVIMGYMPTTYTPRPGQRRGTEVVDAFGTNWLVVTSPNMRRVTVERRDGGWVFGTIIQGRNAQQIAWRA